MFVDVFKLGPVMIRLMLSIKLKDRFGFRYNSIKKRERQLAPNTQIKPSRVKLQAELHHFIFIKRIAIISMGHRLWAINRMDSEKFQVFFEFSDQITIFDGK